MPTPSTSNNRQDTTRRSHTTLQHLHKKTTMDCVFSSCFVCLSGALFWDGNKAMTYELFCFSLALETYKEAWSRDHNTPLRLNKTGQRGGAKRGKTQKSTKENGTTRPRQPPRCHQRHHSSALGRNSFHLSKEHTRIRMFMVGTQGARNAPRKKKNNKTRLHGCTQPHRRAEQGRVTRL